MGQRWVRALEEPGRGGVRGGVRGSEGRFTAGWRLSASESGSLGQAPDLCQDASRWPHVTVSVWIQEKLTSWKLSPSATLSTFQVLSGRIGAVAGVLGGTRRDCFRYHSRVFGQSWGRPLSTVVASVLRLGRAF